LNFEKLVEFIENNKTEYLAEEKRQLSEVKSTLMLVQAIRKLIEGKATAIVSVVGKRYTTTELQPKMLGGHACVINSAGMTEAERKGEWQVCNL
jgi:hypothetical protein